MFEFLYDLVTEPLGLPIEWYKEWIILGIIGLIAYHIAYDKVGSLYRTNFISGRMSGSFLHWIIRTFYFIVIWAITYGVIWLGKFVMDNKILSGIIVGIALLIVITFKVLLWNLHCRKLAKVEVQNEENDKQE